MEDQTEIRMERRGRVSIIRFNDPATLNAVTIPAAQLLHQHLEAAEADSGAVVLGGDERAFCSGAYLGGGPDAARPGEIDAGLALEDVVNPLVLKMRDLRIPLVVAMRGGAVGMGASLALMGDIVVAGTNAYFLQAFCRIGLVPDGGSPWLLARTVGRVRAMELMMLGEKLRASDAFAWGMVTRLVADDAVEQTALEIAERLADGPRMALGLIRRAAWSAAESRFEDELKLERSLQAEAGYHADFREGVAAFLERRPARFNAGGE